MKKPAQYPFFDRFAYNIRYQYSMDNHEPSADTMEKSSIYIPAIHTEGLKKKKE